MSKIIGGGMSDQKTVAMEIAATVSSDASKTTYACAASGFVAWLGKLYKPHLQKEKYLHDRKAN